MRARLAQAALALALMAVLGWPALATLGAAWTGSGQGTGGGLIAPDSSGFASRAALRPLVLAGQTVRLVLATELVTLPLGVPLALVLFRTDVWGRRVLIFLMALAVFVPMPLHATAWLGAFGNSGRAQAFGPSPILVGWTGAAFVHAMAALPWFVLVAGVGLRTVEPELEEAAVLDLPAWRVLCGVTLRRSVGALAGGALAIAVLTAGDMTVTDLLQVRTYAEEAYVRFQLGEGPASASSAALPPMLVLGGLVALTAHSLLRADPTRLATVTVRGKVWCLGRWRVPLGLAVATTLGNLVALPLYVLVWRAGRVGGNARLGQAPHWSWLGLLDTLRFSLEELSGIRLQPPPDLVLDRVAQPEQSVGRLLENVGASPLVQSLIWSALGASATVVLAWSLAWVGRRPGSWRWVAAASVALALGAPGPVAGMALVLAYRQFSLVYDSNAMLVLADVLRTFPYALIIVWPAVRAIPPEHLEAAALDGYGPWGQIQKVALPSTRGATLAAWGFAFALALGELPATNLVCPPGIPLMTVVIWSLLHTGVESHLAGVALIMLATVAAAGLLAVVLLGRVARPQANTG